MEELLWFISGSTNAKVFGMPNSFLLPHWASVANCATFELNMELVILLSMVGSSRQGREYMGWTWHSRVHWQVSEYSASISAEL